MAGCFGPDFQPCRRLNRKVFISFVVVVLCCGIVFAWIEARAAEKSLRASMMAQALMLAASFDPDQIARLTDAPGDPDASIEHYVRIQLHRIRDTHPAHRFFYIFGRRDGQSPFFQVGTAVEATDHSPLGQTFAEQSPTLAQVFQTRSPIISRPFTDRRSTWISSLVPVIDPKSGLPLAIFGMDVDVQDWRTAVLRRTIMTAMFICLVIFLTGAGTSYLRRRQMADLHVHTKTWEVLRENERKYRMIAENAPDVLFTMDMNLKYTYFSPSVYKFSGYTPGEIMAKTFEQMITPESLPDALVAIKHANAFVCNGDFKRQLSVELELIRKDGSSFWSENEFCFMFDESGQPVGIIGVTRDINRRRTAENELKKSEDRFRSMIQSSADMIFIMGGTGDLSYESPSTTRILGYPEGYFLGKTPYDLIHPDDLATVTAEMDLVARSANSGLPTEFRLKTPEGAWTWLEALASNQFDNPSIRGIVITARDISERKRNEAEKDRLNAQLLQAQKMEAVGHLAGGIAHDFNNMLTIVMGQTELAISHVGAGDALRKNLNIIHEAARRSADLVRQLLGFARLQTINPQVLNINATIGGMLTMLRRLIGEEIEMAWIPDRSLGKIKIDPSQVDQILANLMVNARDAIDGAGKITIATGHATLDEAYCGGHTGFLPGRYVVLTVSDSGCGMSKETQAKIFDPFFTTKARGKGTGLGLATIYGIVKQNNGFINVYSEPGQGTTFRIYLPVIDALLDPPGPETKAEPLSGGTGLILLVEDDSVLLTLGQTMIEELGYSVIATDIPEHAIALAHEHRDNLDLLITDVVMPQMSGLELVRHIQKIMPDLKCLYMSGYPADTIAHHGILDKGVHFLQKPFSIRDLAAKIREVIER